MHPAAYNWVRVQVAEHGPFRRVLEIGSRDINGSVRPLFGDTWYLGVDIAAGPGVDRVLDASEYVDLGRFDCVVCCEVLEHTPKASQIVANGCRWLAPGGWLILTAAGPGRLPHGEHGSIHWGEGWYRNIERADLEDWLADLEAVEIRLPPQDIQATARKPLS